MDFLHKLFLFVHLLAIAGLIGSLLAQLTTESRSVSAVMIWSARIAFLAGLGLVAVLEADDVIEVNHAKVGVKLLVALVIVGLLEANRKKPALAKELYYTVLGLAVANVGVAVFWTGATVGAVSSCIGTNPSC
jgi:hypothetical protein